MAKSAIDLYTFLHFLAGIIATYVLYPNDIFISFMVANLCHLLLEWSEKNVHPITGEQLESDTNHVTDVIAFFIGSAITIILYLMLPTKYLCVENKRLRTILIVIIGITIMFEIVREMFPTYYLNDYFKGTYQ